MLTQDMNPGLLRLLLERMERERDDAIDALKLMERRYAELVRRMDDLKATADAA